MVRTQPDDDYDRKLLADIESHGWHLVGIDDDPDGPGYVFSVGMFHTLGQPEVCIFGLSNTSTMGQIINGVGDLVRSGQEFGDWVESIDVLDGFSCMFRNVDDSLYQEHFGYARWYYEGDDFPMLQCVWPDRNHRYPWDLEFDPEMLAAQPILATKTAWAFREGKNRAVFTTKSVIEEGQPILLVSHDDDDEWQFHCGSASDTADARLVSLGSIVEVHPSVSEVADLPMGWQAIRDSPEQPWRCKKVDER